MGRNFVFEEGQYYHCYNRGVDKRVLFQIQKDYRRFLSLLYLANSIQSVHLSNLDRISISYPAIFDLLRGESLVDIIAYCLMGNHYHLLLFSKQAGGISKFMQKLSTAYTMYFNVKNERSGALFGGRFHARKITDDEYLNYLIQYIHLNPLERLEPKWKETYTIQNRTRAQQFLEEYPYSSYRDYVHKDHKRPERNILTTESLPELEYRDPTEADFILNLSQIIKVEP